MPPRAVAWIGLIACWIVWVWPFVFRAPHRQKRESITVAGPTRLGILLMTAAVVLACFRAPGTPRTSLVALMPAAAFAAVAVLLSWTSVQHLGKQFRVHAGLYADHELVRTGPYALVRHPIYASALAMLLTTMVLLTPWLNAWIALALFIAGTEIRVRAEDRLLASRFGAEFEAYKRSVPAYLPFH